MKEKNKSKNAGGVAIIFIIGVLIIALICCLIYIKQISDKLLLENDNYNKNTQQIIDENINKETKGIEVLGVGKNFVKIDEASEVVLDGYENKYCSIEYDLDKDGVKDKISLEYVEEDYYSDIIINDKKIERIEHSNIILYIVDLKEDDSKLNIVLYAGGDYAGDERYYILDYKNNKLINLRDIIGEKYVPYTDELCIDKNGKMAIIDLDEAPFYGATFFANYYLNYLSNNEIKIVEIDFSKELPRDMKIKEDIGGRYFYTLNKDVFNVVEKYHEKSLKNPKETLEGNGIYSCEGITKIQVIDYYYNIIEAKLENGQIIYMFPTSGYLAG